jgi:hypothetical protein
MKYERLQKISCVKKLDSLELKNEAGNIVGIYFNDLDRCTRINPCYPVGGPKR